MGVVVEAGGSPDIKDNLLNTVVVVGLVLLGHIEEVVLSMVLAVVEVVEMNPQEDMLLGELEGVGAIGIMAVVVLLVPMVVGLLVMAHQGRMEQEMAVVEVVVLVQPPEEPPEGLVVMEEPLEGRAVLVAHLIQVLAEQAVPVLEAKLEFFHGR